jgi:hypothetical protein
MKKILICLASLLVNTASYASNSPEQELIDYFKSSSLEKVQDKINNCQLDMKKLDTKIYNSGFWQEVKSIQKLGVGKLTNELKIQVAGDDLQLIGAEKQPSDLYNKSKKLLLANGLILTHELNFKNYEGSTRNLSTFKKPKYSIESIQATTHNLIAEHDIVSESTHTCLHQVLDKRVVDNLILNNNQKKLTLTENFYRAYPELKKDKIIERIFDYQTDKYYRYSESQQKIIKEDFKFYNDKTKKLLTDILYAAMKSPYVKKNGVERELNELYEHFYHWKQELLVDIRNIVYYEYDAVNGMQ